MSGISAAPLAQYEPNHSESRGPEATAARTQAQSNKNPQEGQGALRRSESSELSSLLSQESDFLTGHTSGSPSNQQKIKIKVKTSQRRYPSSIFYPLVNPDESLDDLDDSDSEFELEEDEDPVGREMRSSASRPRPSRTMTDLQAIHTRSAPLTRRASMPHGTSHPAISNYTVSKDLRKRQKRKPHEAIAQLGEKIDGGTVTKRGKGWIVIEESDDEEVPITNNPSDTAGPLALHPPSPSPRAGKKRKRKSSESHAHESHAPSSISGAQPSPPKKVARSSERNALDIGELKRLVIRRLSESLSKLV